MLYLSKVYSRSRLLPFLFEKKIQEEKDKGSSASSMPILVPQQVLKESEPLFGVFTEEQVGLYPMTGIPHIAYDVLEGMRMYLIIATGSERLVREERVNRSLE